MRPAISVVLLTTLLGAGQGLFLALYAIELAGRARLVLVPDAGFFVVGAAVAVALCAAGLIASIFHLGRPSRGWRAASQWRTSWLSREVIALPLFMAAVWAWGIAHYLEVAAAFGIGMAAAVLCIALFVCTGMIYATLRLLQEWATPLTPINYLLLGCASGTTLAAAYAAAWGSPLAGPLGIAAFLLTLAGAATRIATLQRNRSLRPRSTLQSAIGIAHPRIRQTAQGQMGGSFNTREFFHGRTAQWLRAVRWGFLLLAFAVPLALLGLAPPTAPVLATAFLLQYAGLLAERWYFFADANHPQNLYYQAIS
jgi:DMSO reductase anchor subunit